MGRYSVITLALLGWCWWGAYLGSDKEKSATLINANLCWIASIAVAGIKQGRDR